MSTRLNPPVYNCPSEADTIAAYSTPGLRKHELTRSSKKDQLLSLLGDRRRDEIEIILIELYGPEEEAQHGSGAEGRPSARG